MTNPIFLKNKITNKVKIGIIGIGHMGQYHLSIMNTLINRYDVIGIFDEDRAKAKEAATKFENEYFEDMDELLNQCEAVAIAVPTSYHYPVARKALLQKKHVLLEKPITETVEQAEELINIAKENDLVLQVGHVERFNGAVQQITKIINNPLLVECRRMNPFTPRIKDVGVVFDLMIHDIDIVANIIDSPIVKVSASGLKIFSEEHEDVANVQIQFANGCIASLSASRATQDKIRTLSIAQEKSYIFLNYADQDIQIHRQASSAYLTTREEIRYSQESFIEKLYVHKDNPLKLEHIHFYECITKQTQPLVTGEMDIRILKLTHNIINLIRNPGMPVVTPKG